MKNPAPLPEAARERGLFLLLLAGLAALAAGGILLLRYLRPPAGDLHIGDPTARVFELLGEPEREFGSLDEIQGSRLAPMGFTFESRTDPASEPCRAPDLPGESGRALWFPFGPTAGTLVYLDSQDRVAEVYSAGT